MATHGLSLLLLFTLAGVGQSCVDPALAYRFTGAVCRLTYPAAITLNEKTTEVIKAAFQHAKYPSIVGEKSMSFIGKLQYGLHNLEIHNLSISKSEVEMLENEGIKIDISNVSAVFKGTLQYTYGSALFSTSQSLDFEIESQIDLVINSKLYCGNGRVAADTSDCSLTFHKLKLLLQGDREPGFIKNVLTNFITFTMKLVVKGQICKEINKVANILADFIQETAGQFLSDGDIHMDVGVNSAPIITSNYVESYHKFTSNEYEFSVRAQEFGSEEQGLVVYKESTSVILASVFNPSQLTQNRSLYFWISDDVMSPLMTAAHNDGRLFRNISGKELMDLFPEEQATTRPKLFNEWLSSKDPLLKTWSASLPTLWTTTQGTSVKGMAVVELYSANQDTPTLHFVAEVEVLVRVSYIDKNLILNTTSVHVSISDVSPTQTVSESLTSYLIGAVKRIGIPTVTSYLEPGLTTLMNRQGLHLFDLINPEVIPQNGYVIIQMDFGFPQHLLVEFLRKTLE